MTNVSVLSFFLITKLSLSKLSSLLSLLQLLLSLPELGQGESSDLLRLLDLLLVSLDLLLQLGCQLRHSLLVLLVLINLESEFLDPSLRLLIPLSVLPSMSLYIAKLYLQLPDTRLQLCHGSSSSTDRVLAH